MSKQIDFLLKVRDGAQTIADAANEFLESLAPSQVKGDKSAVVHVQETTFIILTFETHQGSKMGEYDVAYRQQNLVDKWTHALNILRQNNSTINSRYHGEGYVYAYWLYGQDKIYRQKLKPKI